MLKRFEPDENSPVMLIPVDKPKSMVPALVWALIMGKLKKPISIAKNRVDFFMWINFSNRFGNYFKSVSYDKLR